MDSQRWRNPGEGGHPVRIAIAEDSVLLREGLARLLTDAGFEVQAGAVMPTSCSAPSATSLPMS
jgi:hypothetical protein